MTNKNNAINRKPLFLLILIFTLPILIGTLLYYFHGYISFKTVNHGVLLKTPINLEELNMLQVKDRKWQIAYLPANCCDEVCAKQIFLLGQLKKALGEKGQRVSVKLLGKQLCQVNELHNAELEAISLKQTQLLQSAIQESGEKKFEVMNKIFLIDPDQNLFMYYPGTTDPMNVLSDLKRVLEVSQIG